MTQTIRTFFALKIPESIQQIARKIQSNPHLQMDHARWSRIQDLHITLKFIPNLKKDHIPNVLKNISAQFKNMGSFYLELGPLELFPNSKNPRLLCLGMKPSKKCLALVQTLDDMLLPLGYPIETRAFRGHLTLARFQTHSMDEVRLQKIIIPVIPKIHVSKLYLFESKPSHQGSSYKPLTCVDLVNRH